MEPRIPTTAAEVGGHYSSRNSRPQNFTSHRLANGSNGNNVNRMPAAPAIAAAPPQLEHLHAAEVLASFQQYPIRASTKAGPSRTPPQTAFGNSSYALPHQPQRQQHRQQYDPLLHDMQTHSRDLDTTLLPILRTPEGAPGTDYDLNNCRGVRGIGGSMLPGNEGAVRNYRARPALEYVTPSPTATSPEGSRPKQETYGAPVQLQMQPQSTSRPAEAKPEKEEFKTTFQFVVNEDAKEARNTVRKHVMREYRRRERWEQGQKVPPEKKPSVEAPKKRRRKQTQSPKDALRSRGQETVVELPASAGEQRRDSPVRNHGNSPTTSGSGGSPSGSNCEAAFAPTKKKLKLVPPVFAESKQHQLWGAVATDYDDAIAELEGRVRPYAADPWASVAANEIDPFSKLKLELGPATASLLHHCTFIGFFGLASTMS